MTIPNVLLSKPPTNNLTAIVSSLYLPLATLSSCLNSNKTVFLSKQHVLIRLYT